MRFLPVLLLLCVQVPAQGADAPEPQVLGRFAARALYRAPRNAGGRAPAVILIPGSGETGPEEMMPAEITLSGKKEALLDQFAQPFRQAGYATLQLGKPGVEFNELSASRFYDQNLYNRLTWPDYLNHIVDAIQWLAAKPGVDPTRIYLLGHSEGTQAVVDVASAHPELVRGVFLLGYAGEDLKRMVEWQLIDREIEMFLQPDVDLNHDGVITHEEAAVWDDTFWPNQILAGDAWSLEKCRTKLHEFRDWTLPQYEAFPLWKGIFDRGPIHALVASLRQSVRVFTGELDPQTPARESRDLAQACAAAGKTDCRVTIVPRVGHGFSEPRGPRKQRFIDATIGPAEPAFLEQLRAAAAEEATR